MKRIEILIGLLLFSQMVFSNPIENPDEASSSEESSLQDSNKKPVTLKDLYMTDIQQRNESKGVPMRESKEVQRDISQNVGEPTEVETELSQNVVGPVGVETELSQNIAEPIEFGTDLSHIVPANINPPNVTELISADANLSDIVPGEINPPSGISYKVDSSNTAEFKSDQAKFKKVRHNTFLANFFFSGAVLFTGTSLASAMGSLRYTEYQPELSIAFVASLGALVVSGTCAAVFKRKLDPKRPKPTLQNKSHY